ncbi:hypothetical protein LINGRAHAP2_LOCUS18266 [Linum grandiflorum]
MSGVSLAVAAGEPTARPRQQQQTNTMMGGIMGSLRVIELQLVAFIMVFSLSGLVPLLDLIFPLFVSAYLLALSRLAFPSRGRSTPDTTIFHGSRMFRAYVIMGTTIGLFLPLAYVLGGFARGDNSAVKSATPHLFLLSCQILTENLVGGLGLFSPPVRALVPLMYTVRRVFVVLDWIQDVWVEKTLAPHADFAEVGWYWFGKGLAVANMAYFSTNLLCFLIPRFLPRAFEKYFNEMRDQEIHSKMAEDKPSAAPTSKLSQPPPEKKAD